MPSNRVELAQYIREIGQDLIPLLKTHGLDATAHCVELAVHSASEVITEAGEDIVSVKPPLTLVRTSTETSGNSVP